MPFNTIEQALQLCIAQRHFISTRGMNHKLALLKTLTPDRIAVTIKKQDLHLVALSIDENVEIAIEWIITKMVFNQSTQTVVALAHIGGSRTQPDAHIAFREKH